MIEAQPGGRDQRQQNRRSKRDRSIARLRHTFEQWQRALAKPIWSEPGMLGEQDYDVLMQGLRDKIVASDFAPSETMRLLRMVSQYSFELVDRHDLLASPFTPPVTLGRLDSRRTLAGFRHHMGLRAWNHAFEERLIAVGKQSPDAQTLLGLTLWSAIARGTLCDPHLVSALRERLLDREPCLERSLGGQLAIRLVVPVASDTVAAKHSPDTVDEEGGYIPASSSTKHIMRRANQIDKETAIRVHRWVPDALTLALIHRYLEATDSPKPLERTIDTIRFALWGQQKPHPNHVTMEQLCRHSIWLADDRPGLSYSESLCEVARSKWSSLGLDDTAHTLCLGQTTNQRNSPLLAVATSAAKAPKQKAADWTWHKKLQEPVARVGSRRRQRSEVIADLESIKVACPADRIEHLIVSWLLHLLTGVRPLAVGTIATYHSRITHRLIDALAGQSVTDLDSADFELVYRSIIDQVRTQTSREQVAGRIGQLHDFGVRSDSHRLPHLAEPIYGGSGIRMVRARHISAHHLTVIAAALPTLCDQNAALVETVTQAVVIAYRCGLRLGEVVKLRLCDIEVSLEKTLFVVENRFGTNKSASARRQLPLAAMLTDEERAAFDSFERRRRLSAKANDPFIALSAGRPLSDKWLSQTVSRAMRRALGGEDWTFHHLRHAAVNNLFLVLEDEHELAESLSGWSAVHQQLILGAVVGDVQARQKRYIAMATFVGHIDPQETFESYIHLVDYVMAARRGRQPTEADLNLYAAALNRAPGRIAGYATEQAMVGAVAVRMGRWIQKTPPMKSLQPAPDATTSAAPTVSQSKVLPTDCIEALKVIERGGTVEEAALAGHVDGPLVEIWVERATHLAALKTKYGNPRLFTSDRVKRTASDHAMRLLLLPTMPKGAAEWTDCEALFGHFRSVWSDPARRTEAEWWLRYSIDRADPSNSGMAFNNPADVARYLAIFDGSRFSGNRWHLQIELGNFVDAGPYLACMPNGSTNTDRRPASARKVRKGMAGRPETGEVRLQLNRPLAFGKTVIDPKNRRATPTVRFVAHILAIMTVVRSSEVCAPPFSL